MGMGFPLALRWHARAPAKTPKLFARTSQGRYVCVQIQISNESNPMTAAKSGDTVSIHYTGTLADGSVFDSSEGRDPLEFEVGSGMIIVGLDKAIPGMKVGDKKIVNIPSDEAYGDVNPDARQSMPRDQFPDSIPVEVGTQLQMQGPDGNVILVTIAEVGETEVTLDANHALAGKELTFDFEIVSITAA
jgi:peptidylprolyl isomerase